MKNNELSEFKELKKRTYDNNIIIGELVTDIVDGKSRIVTSLQELGEAIEYTKGTLSKMGAAYRWIRDNGLLDDFKNQKYKFKYSELIIISKNPSLLDNYTLDYLLSLKRTDIENLAVPKSPLRFVDLVDSVGNRYRNVPVEVIAKYKE